MRDLETLTVQIREYSFLFIIFAAELPIVPSKGILAQKFILLNL